MGSCQGASGSFWGEGGVVRVRVRVRCSVVGVRFRIQGVGLKIGVLSQPFLVKLGLGIGLYAGGVYAMQPQP